MTPRFFLTLLTSFWAANLFLHLAWENWQIIFYEGMAEARHADAVWVCSKAAFGDANIALVAYLVAAFGTRSRAWLVAPSNLGLALYFLTGLLITVVFEYLATEVWGRWSYSSRMPVVPVFGTGVLPLLQWLIIPLLSLATTRRMIAGTMRPRQQEA